MAINHTSVERFENIVVTDTSTEGDASGSNESPNPPMVLGNTISWPDYDWYQVKVAGDFTSDVCQGGTSFEVAPGTYVVINLTTGERFADIVGTGDSSGSLPNIAV